MLTDFGYSPGDLDFGLWCRTAGHWAPTDRHGAPPPRPGRRGPVWCI